MTRVHDVVIVGGGIAGTLAVLTAVDRGLDVAWIADEVGFDAQSAHWHGHLHRGRLYDPEREADLIDELGQNVPFWWSNPVIGFHTTVQTVALGHEEEWATAFRNRIGGPADSEQGRPAYVRDDVLTVRTDEAVLDGPSFLSVARELAAAESLAITGRCTALRRRADGLWDAGVTASAGETVRVRARLAVLATGIHNPALTPATVSPDREASARLSRMLVLRGPLPSAAAIIPSRAAGGLFFDSRECRGSGGAERVWLVSDGFSSSGSVSPSMLTDAWWACSVMERLRGFVRDDLLDEVQVAAYRAPKSRVESSPAAVPARGFAVDRELGFVSLMPSKWSTAPTSAVESLAAILPDAEPLAARIAGLAERFASAKVPDVPVFRETWESVDRWVAARDLSRPGVDALRAASRIFSELEVAKASRSVA